MKRTFFLILTAVLLLSLTACGGHTDEAAEYAGEWKASILSENIGGEKVYTVSVLQLNPDGSGSYRGRELSWRYSAEQDAIHVTLRKENQTAAFAIQEQDGIPVLTYYQDVYFRAEDFTPEH